MVDLAKADMNYNLAADTIHYYQTTIKPEMQISQDEFLELCKEAGIKQIGVIYMFKWKDYEEYTALFIDVISENVAILRYKDFQLTDAATGLIVKMKSSNIDEAKVDAENFLKEFWNRVENSYKRNLDALN